jgi:hypothetical protein
MDSSELKRVKGENMLRDWIMGAVWFFAAVLSICAYAHAGSKAKPLTAPRNPYAAASTQAMPHGDSAQQDATAVKGPMDASRQLQGDEIIYRHLGPGYIGGFTTSAYADGTRVLWTNGVNGLYKLNAETLEIYDYIPSPVAGKWTKDHAEDSIAALDADNSLANLPLAIEDSKALQDLSGIYVVVGANNWAYIAQKDGSITAYGDGIEGDPTSAIEVKGRFHMPPEAAGSTLGMNITYDGWIVLPTTGGWLVAVSMDLQDSRLIRLTNPTGESTAAQRVGYGWVRNSLALDKDGGIYIASRNHMHKVIWDGEQFSTDEEDGAWVAEYPNDLGTGTGSTPSLMGFGEEDQFVVITDGNELMSVVLFWRNEIPEDWEQLPDAPTRRIAGMAPATMGELDLKAVQTEQSVVVAGYGAFVVNNTPNNIPEGLPPNGHGLLAGALGSNPVHQPFGVQKMEWNPETREFGPAWTNTAVSSPNGVPYVSLGTNHVYFIGARGNKWTLEALNWDTGESTFHYVIGGQRYNSQYSCPIPDEFGGMMYGTTWGRARISPKN